MNDVAEKKTVKKKPIKRVYSNDMKIDSDLFKLEVANMKKNIGYHNNNPLLADVEHCHFYRTIDSNGRQQTKCNYVGSHAHVVEITDDGKGNLLGSCGPAIGSKFKDPHVHNVQYIRSDKISRRKLNEDAQLSINNREKA